MCWGLILVSLPRIFIVFMFIWLFESLMQLNSIRRFSYLAMKGSRSEFSFISIWVLILISGSVVAVTKNLCNNLFTWISYWGFNFYLSSNFRLLKVYTASSLISGFSFDKYGKTESLMNYKILKFDSISSNPKLLSTFMAKIIIYIYSYFIYSSSSFANFFYYFESLTPWHKFKRKN
jgi:hypothetical protein